MSPDKRSRTNTQEREVQIWKEIDEWDEKKEERSTKTEMVIPTLDLTKVNNIMT